MNTISILLILNKKQTMRKFTFILVVFLGSLFMLGCQKEISLENRNIPTPQQALLNLGDSAQGGIVYYILQLGDNGYDPNVQHGLIAATEDQGSLTWNNNIQMTYPITSNNIGMGSQNTDDIIAALGPTTSGNSYAAEACRNLTLNGYNDWYLPSEAELSLLREFVINPININNPNQTNFIASFINGVYWNSSSNSRDAGFVWMSEDYIMIF